MIPGIPDVYNTVRGRHCKIVSTSPMKHSAASGTTEQLETRDPAVDQVRRTRRASRRESSGKITGLGEMIKGSRGAGLDHGTTEVLATCSSM